MLSHPIKPTHKPIQGYYEKLRGYGAQDVTHEMGLRSAFQQLLEETGRPHKWTLVPEQSLKVRGKTVRPDGTSRAARDPLRPQLRRRPRIHRPPRRPSRAGEHGDGEDRRGPPSRLRLAGSIPMRAVRR